MFLGSAIWKPLSSKLIYNLPSIFAPRGLLGYYMDRLMKRLIILGYILFGVNIGELVQCCENTMLTFYKES